MARQLRCEDYTVGWVCALPVEQAAAREMLDDEYDTPRYYIHDTNVYTCGRIGGHNVVIACALSDISTKIASLVAIQMTSRFSSIRFCLMVGIGGGVPSEEADVRLGDVVVSGELVQYDYGKVTSSGFGRATALALNPPPVLLNAVAALRIKHMRGRGRLLEHLAALDDLPGFSREAAGLDILINAEYDHDSGSTTCENCSKEHEVIREARQQEVVVHYGTIASSNMVMRSASERDRVSAELGGVMCFETEATGLTNSFPCLVIRGISDYADSHKNKRWQPYAAGTAAAYAKELLSVIPPADVMATRRVGEVMAGAHSQYNDHISRKFVYTNDVTERDSQPSSPKHPFEQTPTIPSTVSYPHAFSDQIWSSTGKDSEAITDATDHTTQDPTFGAQDDKQKERPSLLEPSTARTVYAPSATLTSPALRDKGYMVDLASELFGVVNSPGLTRDALDRISQLLPDLLRAFAVKIGYQAPTSMHRDVMFYVRRDRM